MKIASLRRALAVAVAALVVLATAGFAPGDSEQGYTPLVGIWVHKGDTMSIVMGFLPDGRYSATVLVGDTRLHEKGRYRVAGKKLTLDPQDEQAVTYDLQLSANTLTLSGGNTAQPMTYEKAPGSEKEVVEQAQKADAKKAKEDAEWRARLPVGPMGKQPAALKFAVGEVPADPASTRIFAKPIVFTKLALYVSLSSPMTLELNDGTTRTVFNSWKWYFLPTGRVFIRTVSYRANGPATGDVTTAWGRYTVAPSEKVEKEEKITVETDQGEKIDLSLIDGRRNLLWGKKMYGNVEWENEALRRR